MNLLGVKIKHANLGVGEIIEIKNNTITVVFPGKTTRFMYPAAFETYIQAIDENIQAEIMAGIENDRKAEEERKRIEEERKRAEREKREAEEAEKRARNSRVTKHEPIASKRTAGKRMIFWVFQGKSFDSEFRGGYIWAPISNKSGMTFHHWTRLVDVRQGDIILHGCDGMLKAISVAEGSYIDCKQPRELEVEDLWDADGRMVECDYTQIRRPIYTSTYKNDIIRLSRGAYSPFNKNGDGNMGYLFEINRELAKIFISETVKKNPYLSEIDYIDELLQEDN